MANVKISQLPSTNTPQGAGLIPIVQDGTTYSTTATDLVALAAGGVTSFNTRDGAITLLDTDVTGALEYTPVPETRDLTINGVTQDLSANRTWTISTGAVTYPFTGSNVNAGDPVVINDDGTVSSIKYNTTVSPSANLGITSTYLSSGAYNGLQAQQATVSVVNPHNPSMVASIFLDNSGVLWAYISSVPPAGSPLTMMPSNTSLLSVYGGGGVSTDGLCAHWDPFYPERFAVMFNASNTIFLAYVFVENVWDANNYIKPIASMYSLLNLGGGANNGSFQFSEKYPNLISYIYTNTSNSNFLMLNSAVIYQGNGIFNANIGTPIFVSTDFASYTVSDMARLEGEDKFAYTTSVYNNTTAQYASYCYIWEFDAFNGYTPPSTLISSRYTIIDNSGPYANGVNKVNTKFIDSSRLYYAFWYYSSMDVVNSMIVANYSGITISSVGAVVGSTFASPDIIQSNSQSVMPIGYDKNYVLWTYLRYNSSLSSYYIAGQIVKINGSTIGAYSSQFTILDPNTAPSSSVVSVYATNSFVINNTENGIANLSFFFYDGNTVTIRNAVTPITYVNQLFNKQNLLGVAQNTVVTSGTVNVLPFGGIDDNQSNLTAGTYYLQNDGTLTQNVTPYLFGRALDATTIKTTNYPTI